MGAYPGNDSVRLLRVIKAQQAHGRVGSIVFPFAVARSAGLGPGTERYEEALWNLVWEGAMAVNECVLGLPRLHGLFAFKPRHLLPV